MGNVPHRDKVLFFFFLSVALFPLSDGIKFFPLK